MRKQYILLLRLRFKFWALWTFMIKKWSGYWVKWSGYCVQFAKGIKQWLYRDNCSLLVCFAVRWRACCSMPMTTRCSSTWVTTTSALNLNGTFPSFQWCWWTEQKASALAGAPRSPTTTRGRLSLTSNACSTDKNQSLWYVTAIILFSSCCPAVTDEVGRGYCHLFFSSPHFVLSLTAFSITSLHLFYLLLLCSILLPLFLLTQSSHHILSFPHLFPSSFWAFFTSPILSTCPAHFSLLLTGVWLKLSFTAASTVSSSILSSLDSSYPVVFVNLHLLLFLC